MACRFDWQAAKLGSHSACLRLHDTAHLAFIAPPSPPMKKSLQVSVVSLLLIPAALVAATFEGKVTMKMTSGRSKPQDITYSIKGDKVRMEIPEQKGMGGMIMDTTKREMTMIMDEQKMYMVMALPDSAKEAIAKREQEVTLEKTNETDTILGYKATKYLVKDKDNETEMWLAEGLGTFMGMSSNRNPMARGGGTPPPAWERALAGKEMFPLRVVGYDKGKPKKGGNEAFKMEVTAINKASLPDSMFTPPAGYQKFDMGAMMKGMIPGR
jgi:hypothetical protein